MNKFDIKDWPMEDKLQTEIGNDDFIYGNFIDWNNFRHENEDELIEYLDVYLPWEKEINVFEYMDFYKQFETTGIKLDEKYTEIHVSNSGVSVSNLSLLFPSHDSNLISNIFDYCKVPSGTTYENELPDIFKYWQQEYDENYLKDYLNYPVNFEKYKKDLEHIYKTINEFTDPMVKKSLILTSFILSESLFKSIITDKIPRENHISSWSQKLLTNEINKKMRSTAQRNNLFKSLFNENVPKQEWTNLRNSLAHDIESSVIKNDKIIYTNLQNHGKNTILIETLFEQQYRFAESLKNIIYRQHTSYINHN